MTMNTEHITAEPSWLVPSGKALPKLRVYNTLTREKVEFVPQNGFKFVRWYSCGPTVYDAAHMGHARNYVTTDILRRILEEYFGYHVQFIMNITDIDDKIIVRARQRHLLYEYSKRLQTLALDTLLGELEAYWLDFVNEHFPLARFGDLYSDRAATMRALDALLVDVKRTAEDDPKRLMHWKTSKEAYDMLAGFKHGSVIETQAFMGVFSDILGPKLDGQSGSGISDPAIFRDLSAYWEAAFLKDMDRLAVLRPSVMTRVSEYIPAIVQCINEIMANGYAYEVEGSIYFDTAAFKGKNKHVYAKLCPHAASNVKLIEEGEGALSGGGGMEKKSHADFALWKKSKAGEPSWSSPWGHGRPGWHIECSAMASDVAPGVLDIHSGGIDLAFPHHDNELAQSEAQYECAQWVNYFLHMGHLHIEGQKMSKSLKNFITIQEALEKHSARQMRLLFLMHSWSATLDYKETSMKEAVALETLLVHFFDELEALVRANRPLLDNSTGIHFFNHAEKSLAAKLYASQASIYEALADSFDTPKAVREIKELVGFTRGYIKSKGAVPLYGPLLETVGVYVTKMLKVFGVIPDESAFGFVKGSASAAQDRAETFALATVVSGLRDKVRALAMQDIKSAREEGAFVSEMAGLSIRNGGGHVAGPSLAQQLLGLCDQLRDNELFDLGVVLEDREGQPSLVKLVDKEAIVRIREEKRAKEAESLSTKSHVAEMNAAKLREREERAKILPSEMFANSLEYAKWDEKGIPTHDAAGRDISKSRRKRLVKEYEAQVELCDAFHKA